MHVFNFVILIAVHKFFFFHDDSVDQFYQVCRPQYMQFKYIIDNINISLVLQIFYGLFPMLYGNLHQNRSSPAVKLLDVVNYSE